MTLYRVYRLSFDYETESKTKEYLKETFSNKETAKKVCELHKKIDGGIYLYDSMEIDKTYDSYEEYKQDCKYQLIDKEIKHILKHRYSFLLLVSDDYGDFNLDDVYLTVDDMEKIIKGFENTNKKSVITHNSLGYVVKVRESDLPEIIEKKNILDKTLRRLENSKNKNNTNLII